jgi:hypothetical protein
MDDKEIKAITSLANALEPLDAAAVKRVLDWAAAKFGVVISSASNGSTGDRKTSAALDSKVEYGSFADLFDAANPSTERDKVLVAAYWLQEIEGIKEWTSQPANDSLKNLGHPLSNVTRALGDVQKTKPSLVMQTQKSGKSKQARKLYKLTGEGIKVVKRLLAGIKEENSDN